VSEPALPEEEAKRRKRNRFYLLLATLFLVAANVISVIAYILNNRAP
jgi:hypothetical protein